MAKDVCVVVPAFNEARVITESLRALKKVVPKEDIYVVSDGSTDGTGRLAKKESVNLMSLRKNVGKAKALDKLIKTRKLTKRYKYILFSDADSRLSEDFLFEINKYIAKNPACIVGTVVSDRHGLVSAFRTYEYGITHKIFKKAQDALQVITVAPGCAALYRGDVLEKLNFDNHTLTEDFDLTIQIHKKKLGRIIYAPKAVVTTQDPGNLRDYWRQITRWYTGFWQNIFLHRLYLPKDKFNFEVIILIVDSLAWLGSVILALKYPGAFLFFLATTYVTLILISVIIISIERKFWAIFYSPLFIFVYFLNLIGYFYSLARAIINRKKILAWQKVSRY